MAYSRLEATIDGNIRPLAAKLQQADRLGEQFLSKVRQMKIELDPQVIADLREIRDLRAQIGRGTTRIKIQTAADTGAIRTARREVTALGTDAAQAGTKIAVVHKNLQELGKDGVTGLRINPKDLMAGLEEIRAGVLRFKKDFKDVGTGDIVTQINKLEHFFSGQGIKADAFNRVIPELRRVLELQNHIKGNREIDFEIHVNDKGVADIRNLGIVIDGAQKQLNDLALKRRELADQIRSSGTIASVVGGEKNINADLLKRPKLTPNTLNGQGLPERAISRAVLDDLARYDDLLEKARAETKKLWTELDKTQAVAGRTAATFEKVGIAMASRMEKAAEKTKKARDVFGALGRHLEGVGKAASQLQNTVTRWAIGYTIVSQMIAGFQALKVAVVDFNGTLDEARIAFSTLLDSDEAADRLLNKLRQFAKVTPFGFAELVPLTQKMISLGVVAKENAERRIVPALTAIGNAASALGQNGPESIDRIIRALGQMATKGKLQAEELTSQLAEVGIDGARYVAAAMGVTVPKLFSLMKKGLVDGKKAMNAILEGLATDPRFAGMMEKQALTTKGWFSNLKDAATDLASRGFRPLYDEAGRLISEFARFGGSQAGEEWAKRTAERVRELILQVRAAGRTLSDLRAPIGAVGAIIGITFGAAKINQVIKLAGALIQFRKAATALGAVEAAAAFLPGLAPALAPLLAFLANPVVLAVIGGTIAIAGIYAWTRYKNNLAQVREEHTFLQQSARDTAAGLQSLTDAVAGNKGAEALIAKVRRSVNDAGTDAKRLGTALSTIASARYEIKKLKLDPLALRLVQSELDRLRASIEKKAIVLRVQVQQPGQSGQPTPRGRGALNIRTPQQIQAQRDEEERQKIYQQAYERAQKRFSHVLRAGVSNRRVYNLPALKKAAGIEDSNPETLLDTIARQETVRVNAARLRASQLKQAIENFRKTPEKEQPKALQELVRIRDRALEQQKKGVALSVDQERSLARINRLIAQANTKGKITPFGPTKDPETEDNDKAKKARLAALKLEKDRLQDAAQLYEEMASQSERAYADMARAAEESGRRQVEALKGVKDSLRDLLGGMQEYFARFGLLSTPLDSQLEKIQNLVNLGGRLKSIAQNSQSRLESIQSAGRDEASGYRLHGAHARMSLDKLNGGDGNEPARALRASGLGQTIAQAAQRMQVRAKTFVGQCDRLADTTVRSVTTAFNRVMGPRQGDTAAKTMARFMAAGIGFKANGSYAPGDILYSGAKYGKGAGHVMIVGPDGRFMDQYGANTRPKTKPQWVVRPGAMGQSSKVALAAGKAGGVLGQAVVDADGGAELVKEIYAELDNLKLTKLTQLPKEFGAAVKDTEQSTFRFQGQMMLANEATQKLLRSFLGEKKFGELARQIRRVTNEADALKNSLEAIERFEAQAKSIRDARRNRGVEDDPWGQFRRSLGRGGENYRYAGTMSAQKNLRVLRQDAFDQLADEIGQIRANAKDQLSIGRAGASFIGYDSVDGAGRERAQELQSRKIDFRNSSPMRRLFLAGVEVKDVEALMLYNRALQQFEAIQRTAFDEEKGRARMELIASQREELNRQGDTLRKQLGLVRNTALNETQLSDALEREVVLRDKIAEYRDAGFTEGRAKELAEEFVARQQLNRELQRQIDRMQELRQLQFDTDLDVAKKSGVTQLLGSVPGLAMGSGIVDYATARFEKVQELLAQLKSGKLKFLGEMNDRLGLFDAGAMAERDQRAVTDAARAEATLAERRLEFQEKLGDLSRQEAIWTAEDNAAKTLGVTLTEKELASREKIRAALQEIQKLQAATYMREQARDAAIAGIYDPKMQRSVDAILGAQRAGMTPDQIRENLPEILDTAKLKERREQIQQVLSGMRDDLAQTFLNIKDRGINSFTDMFQSISNRLQSFAADILANKVWDWIGGALGGWIGARTGAPATPGFNGSHAAGLYRVPFDGYKAILHKNEMVLNSSQATVERDRSRRDAARDTARMGSAGQGAYGAAGGMGNITFNGPVHLPNVRNMERDLPAAIQGQVQKAIPSRRSSARGLRTYSEVGI